MPVAMNDRKFAQFGAPSLPHGVFDRLVQVVIVRMESVQVDLALVRPFLVDVKPHHRLSFRL